MAQEIIVKVYSKEKELSHYQVKTHSGNPIHIKAQTHTNYELIEKNSGYAPENIATKRVGDDLYIAFEGSDINTPDIIIDDYYNHLGDLIIGKAEDGFYYNYVPESAVEADAISALDAGDMAGQALGGESVVTPLWGAFGGNAIAGLSNMQTLAGLISVSGVAGLGSIAVSDGAESGSEVPVLNSINDAPVIDIPNVDRNISIADNITLDVSSSFFDPDGDTLTYSVTGLPAGLSIDPSTGVISGTVDSSVSQSGSYTVTVTATDPSGASVTDTFILVVSNPAPSADVDDISLTADTTPPLTGTVDDPDATVIVTINGKDYTATNNGDGTWSIPDDMIDPLNEGENTITVKAIDPAGNEGTGEGTVTVDTTAPTITLDEISDDYINAAEHNQDLTISGTTTGVEDGQSVTVVFNDVTYTTQVSNNTFSVTVPATDVQALVDGTTYTATADVSDAAGNAAQQASEDVTVDTTAPSADVDDISLTADTTPPLTGTVDDPDATVIVTINGKDYTATNNGDGTWSIPDDTIDPLNEGENTITVKAIDPAGNEGTGEGTVTVDTTAPTITLDEISDDYINAAEHNQDLIISGTTTGVEDGQSVTVVFNSISYTTQVSNNTFSVTVPATDVQALVDGITYTATA
ncbi:MAG: Ig-like domain-containing protein, partial [Sulfurovum sp.]|nr:Ig-like domain-containing protein [Sulfurovum sp.]